VLSLIRLVGRSGADLAIELVVLPGRRAHVKSLHTGLEETKPMNRRNVVEKARDHPAPPHPPPGTPTRTTPPRPTLKEVCSKRSEVLDVVGDDGTPFAGCDLEEERVGAADPLNPLSDGAPHRQAHIR